MYRHRLGLCLLGSIAAMCILGGALSHGQSLAVWQPANLSAVDRGMLAQNQTPPPGGSRRSRRVLRADGVAIDRVGRSGAHYQPGRLIVKFKGSVSTSSRVSALSQVSRTASMAPRPAYADFDVVNIDPNEDAEAAAAAFSARADVEYAQAAYRVHPYNFVPNDPLYQYQWNFPAIDLERGWDIQRGASSSI